MSAERKYTSDDCVTFRKTNEEFGGLSNMAPGFPITLSSIVFNTSEALYQAARYPHRPDLQNLLIDTKSPMTGKMKTKKYRKISREDWNTVQNNVMRWCLRAKLVCNWYNFGELLMLTADRPIVEISHRDRYWGTVQQGPFLVGQNILGRLLMELRQEIITNKTALRELPAPDIENFLFLGSPPPTLVVDDEKRTEKTSQMKLF